MFSDPLVLTRDWTTITANAARNLSLACSERAPDHSSYRFTDSQGTDFTFKAAHSYGRSRNRFTIRLDAAGILATVADPTQYAQASQSCYAVFDCPSVGPIMALGTTTNLAREQMTAIGGLLVAVGADPTFLTRVAIAGET